MPRLSVSIITPSYNQAEYLAETIASVTDQDYPNIEHIVIDGGSSDSSVDIIRRYADRLAFWVSEKDRGQSHAINKGFAHATGDIVAWLNSDDIYCPGALRTVAQYFAAHPDVDVLYGNSEYIGAAGDHLGYYPAQPFNRQSLLAGISGDVTNFLPQPSVFVRSRVVRGSPLVDDRLQFTMDFDLWARLAQKYRFASISQVLSKYRITPTAKTSSLRLRGAAELAVVLYRYGTAPAVARAIAFYFALAAEQGIAPHKARIDLINIFARCGHSLATGFLQSGELVLAAYGGGLIRTFLPLWHNFVVMRHRSPIRSGSAQHIDTQYYGPIPMRVAVPNLD